MFSHKYAPSLVVVCLIMTAIALGSYTYSTLKQINPWTGPTTITVEGSAEITAVPDVATFTFSVEADGEDATVAQEESATHINDILVYLREQGVTEADITTQYYNMYPKYRYESVPCPQGSFYCPPGEQIEDGFTVTQTIAVKVRQTDIAGSLLSGVGERGATNVSNLSFTVDDTDALKAEAREQAIADAKAKAKVLADNLGGRLGRITGFYENNGGMMPYMESFGMGGDMMATRNVAEAPETPRGEQTISSTVNLTYEIKTWH